MRNALSCRHVTLCHGHVNFDPRPATGTLRIPPSSPTGPMSPSTRVLVILTVLEVFSVAMSKGNEKRYSNSWAVEIIDSREPADAVAARHGFTNRGLVSEATEPSDKLEC